MQFPGRTVFVVFVTLMPLPICLGLGSGPREVDGPLHAKEQHHRIICPFLGALINEGVLEVKALYRKEELMNITLAAGLDPVNARDHIDGNFKNNPSGLQDIFAMEGASNEHFTSTGVNDCPTFFRDCFADADGVWRCANETANIFCGLPNPAKFEEFWAAVDANHDGIMTRAELEATEDLPLPFNDANPIGEGTIAGSFGLIMAIFGATQDMIEKEALRRVIVLRKFPVDYAFPPPLHAKRHHHRIICPFLGALINEGVLEVKALYSKEELMNITLAAGLDGVNARDHIDGNFKNNPSGLQDIFAMEGASNEHFTSTGVNDCPTFFHKCFGDADGVWRCANETANISCGLPNQAKFEEFWAAVDANDDGIMTRAELEATTDLPLPFIDSNPIGEGTIAGSFGFIMEAFGATPDMMEKEALRRVMVLRKFPLDYTFPPQ